ncbi:MAG: DUF4838 domain-containing protein [Candidatus Latescibacterota bacterium]
MSWPSPAVWEGPSSGGSEPLLCGAPARRPWAPRVFMQANGDGRTGEPCDLRNCMIGRMLWDPEQDHHSLMCDFCERHYGPASSPGRRPGHPGPDPRRARVDQRAPRLLRDPGLGGCGGAPADRRPVRRAGPASRHGPRRRGPAGRGLLRHAAAGRVAASAQAEDGGRRRDPASTANACWRGPRKAPGARPTVAWCGCPGPGRARRGQAPYLTSTSLPMRR